MTNPSKRSARPSAFEPYLGDKPDPNNRLRGTAGEEEKSPEPAHADPGAIPAGETGQEGQESDDRLWAIEKLQRTLVAAIVAKQRELELILRVLRERKR